MDKFARDHLLLAAQRRASRWTLRTSVRSPKPAPGTPSTNGAVQAYQVQCRPRSDTQSPRVRALAPSPACRAGRAVSAKTATAWARPSGSAATTRVGARVASSGEPADASHAPTSASAAGASRSPGRAARGRDDGAFRGADINDVRDALGGSATTAAVRVRSCARRRAASVWARR